MSGIGIDWRSADVRDGRLTVAFTEKPAKDWVERLERVVKRLHRPSTGWQSIEVKKTKLTVDAVAPGSEADLRHFLDSALLQANAEPEGDDDAADDRSEQDQALTRTFRGFAGD